MRIKDKIRELNVILVESEKKLKKLIADSADAGEYDAVESARTAAVTICNLRSKLNISRPHSKNSGGYGKSQKEKISSQVLQPAGYPKFEIINDSLIRTGWSKKEKVEYAHSVPKSAFDATVKAMENLTKHETEYVTAEDIISSVESVPVPSYQVYVTIGVLRQKGHIKKIGRKGYKIPLDIATKAEMEWKNLLVKK